MSKKCICLVRVSTEQQKLEGQKEKVISAAISDGYKLEEIAVVEGKESAIKLQEEERETLNEMKNIIAQYPTIESVYVFAIDRLARKVSIILSVKDYLLKNKVNLVFLNPRKLATMIRNDKGVMVEDEMTSMMLLFLGYGAEMEMKIKLARWKATKDIMRSNNQVTSGRPMFGYKKAADKSVVVDEVNAGIVRDIYTEYIEGKVAMYDLYKKYVAKGVFKMKKKSAAKQTILRILTNTAYYGDYSSCDKIKNLKYPPIVSKEVWDKANGIARNRGKVFKLHHKNIYYGKSLVRLMNSGLLMQVHLTNLCYKCFESEVPANININAIDSLLWMTTCKLQVLRLGMQQRESQYNFKKEIAENEKQIKHLNGLLETIYNKEKKAFDMYLSGKVKENVYDEIMLGIENDKAMWENEIAKLQSENAQYRMASTGKGDKPIITQRKLALLNDEERKNLIDEVIKEVQLTKNDDASFDIKIVTNDVRLGATYNELFLNPHYHYYVRGGVMHLFEINDDMEIEISEIIEKRITTDYKDKAKRAK